MLYKWLVELGKLTGMTLSQYNPGKKGCSGCDTSHGMFVPMVMGDPQHPRDH